MRSRRRRGFTLIELLVVISIIGILVGLLLPAIQSAREAGRRTQCSSNMRNVGMAILQYINANNTFPSAGTFGEDATAMAAIATALSSGTTPDPTTSVIPGYITGSPRAPGSADLTKSVPMYSWVVPILPYMEAQDMFNQWTMYTTASTTVQTPGVSYLDSTNYVAGQSSNYTIGNTAIGVLRCPDDITAQPNQGNLSYVVNGGFALWHAVPYTYIGSSVDAGQTPQIMTWTPSSGTLASTIGTTTKLGVMFLQSAAPHGSTTNIPWNVRSTLAAITDGASSTLMLSENTLAGVTTTPSAFTSNLETNWAAPMPSINMFIGSGSICASASYNCSTGTLAPASATITAPTASGDADGVGWAYANKVGTYENINFGTIGGLTIKGSFPFTNSGHPGGANMMFCDGAVRFINSTIDGTVYAKMITPGGGRLPLYCKQMPLSQDAFVNQ